MKKTLMDRVVDSTPEWAWSFVELTLWRVGSFWYTWIENPFRKLCLTVSVKFAMIGHPHHKLIKDSKKKMVGWRKARERKEAMAKAKKEWEAARRG